MRARLVTAAALSAFVALSGCGTNRNSTSDVVAGERPSTSLVTGPESDPESSTPSAAMTATAGASQTGRSGLVTQTTFGSLPVPRTGDEAATMLAEMPGRVGAWAANPPERGRATYDHPAGSLGMEAAEIADIYARPVTPAKAIELFGRDMDGGRSESCGTSPGRCVTGHLDGQVAAAWTHDDSKVLLVAVWPDDDARDALLTAWSRTG